MTFFEPLVVPSSDEIEPFYELPQPKQCTVPSQAQVQVDDRPNMTFSSSPVLYPGSSSPAPVVHKSKRKLFHTFSTHEKDTKRRKTIAGFEAEEGEGSGENQENSTITEHVAGAGTQRSIHISTDKPSPVAEHCNEQPTLSTYATGSALPPMPALFTSRLSRKSVELRTCSGKVMSIPTRTRSIVQSYEQIVAQRSTTTAGRAKTAYYGIDIHNLLDEARLQKELNDAAAELRKEQPSLRSVEISPPALPEPIKLSHKHQMWTEKYRAQKFTDLVGDERTHRSVLRWLKGWDHLVFTGNAKVQPKNKYQDQDQDRQHKKILLLTGSPGLGKTTLAHVCARQAGYEVLEINASDDRSRDVVKGRIKDALGTETVRGIQQPGKERRAGRPVCVVVDEVDGVVSGSGSSGGEGGFMRALIDLVHLDKKNTDNSINGQRKAKGDKFRLMRPLIMICNDVYAPSLRPLRQSSLAEIIHVRKPSLDKIISRLRTIFEKEGIACDNDAVRRLCESSWGLGIRKQNSIGGRGAGEGDIRGILVQGEWAAHKLRASPSPQSRLTRKWVESHLGASAVFQKGLGRGGVREVVERIFIEGAGLPNMPVVLSKDDSRLVSESNSHPIGLSELRKRTAIGALREMIDTCGEYDRLMTECFATYPTQIFQDDTLLSKTNDCYEWLHFHDSLSSRIYSGQEWELGSYLGTSACGFHDLFATLDKGAKGWNEEKVNGEEGEENAHPFAGLKADYASHEAEKGNRAIITGMQSNFSAPLLRLFSSVDVIATELIPNVARMLMPEIKPVVMGGSSGSASIASVRKEAEKNCVRMAVRVMFGLGIDFEKVRIEHEAGGAQSNGGYALRMEPPLDVLTVYHFDKAVTSMKDSIPSAPAPVRYAVRQVLSQELAKEKVLQASISRQARVSSSISTSYPENSTSMVPNNSNYHGKENKENRTPNDPKSKAQLQSLAVLNATANRPVKKDFFGRPIISILGPTSSPALNLASETGEVNKSHHTRNVSLTKVSGHSEINAEAANAGVRTWVSFHEGYSNAVRKYISLAEFIDGF